MTRLSGPDISKWQVRTPPLKGQAFAFARATYATSPDVRYDFHVAAFRKAGIVVGAYHFGVGGSQASISSQVAAFARVARNADILALDLERNSRVRERVGGKLVWRQLPTMTTSEGRDFISRLRAAVPGKTILLYSSRGTWPGSLGQDANWIADYTAAARVARRPLTRLPWAFWQYTSTPWDRNEFNGDLAALRRLAGKAAHVVAPQPTPKPASTEPPGRGQRLRVAGSFFDYRVIGTSLIGYKVLGRTSRVTDGGFTAIVGAVISVAYGGKQRRLGQMANTSYKGRWIDLDDETLLP